MQAVADYEFERWLGSSTNGDNFLARPPARLGLTAEHVVVKVISGAASDDAFRRATRELRHFALAKSEKVIKIYDAGRDGNQFFYSMEYLPAGTLQEPAEPLTRDEAVRAVADAAIAADALHENGLAHRDIKPANIWLAADGGRLADLGLSQLLSPGMVFTSLGQIGLEYTDPSILTGGSASRATDIWSLGACLHFAVTGSGVYGHQPTAEPLLLARAVLSSTPTLDPELDPPTAALIRACLDPDPTARPATAADVASRALALG